MPHYDNCPKAVYDLAKIALAHDRYIPFREAGVTYSIWFAYANKDENPITVHGMAARGRAKIINLLDRIKGNSDVEILVDGKWWNGARDRQREALLAHELYYFEVKTDKRDDAGRPVVRLRHHDYQFGWFNCIAEQYGSDSGECEQATALMENSGQLYWPGLETPAQRFDP